MTALAPEEALYLFYLSAADSAPPTEECAGGEAARLFSHCHAGLAAMLGAVAIDEFCGPEAERRLADLEWMSCRALWHERVIEQGFCRAPVLPARFGTLFSSLATLERFMETNRQAIAGFLDKVRGHEEWGIKVLLECSAARQWLRTRVAAKAPDATQASSPGMRYLEARRAAAAADKELQRWLTESCEAIAHSFEVDGAESRQRPLLESAAADEPRELALNLAVLVPRDRRGRLIARVEAINAERAHQGLGCVLSGPWPPYSFCPALTMPP